MDIKEVKEELNLLVVKNQLSIKTATHIVNAIEERDELVKSNSVLGDVSKRGSLIENYEVLKFANEKAASEIKSFCESVMHGDSDLHGYADEWINKRLK